MAASWNIEAKLLHNGRRAVRRARDCYGDRDGSKWMGAGEDGKGRQGRPAHMPVKGGLRSFVRRTPTPAVLHTLLHT